MAADPKPAEASPPTGGQGTTLQYTLVRDLPTTPEVARRVEERCRDAVWWERRKFRAWLEEDLKLAVHYGGRTVAHTRTPKGLVVLAATDDPEDKEFWQFLDSLPRAQRCEILVEFVRP